MRLALRLSEDVTAALAGGGAGEGGGRGLNSFTSQLNLSALYGIGGARRGCVARVRGCLVCLRCVGCFCVSDTAQVELKIERV